MRDAFRRIVQTRWKTLAQLSSAAREPSAVLITWFVDHIRLPQCFVPREARAYANPQEWPFLVRQAWNDLILAQHELSIALVLPDPPDMEVHAIAHVIVTQQPIPDFASVLLTVFDSAVPGTQQRCATLAPAMLEQQTVFALSFLDRDCTAATNECTALHGDQAFFPTNMPG